jgi:4'-phosphopantetheinyl transferase
MNIHIEDKISVPAGYLDLPLPGNVHVWLVHLGVDPTELNSYLQVLSPSEKAKAAKFRFDEDRGRFIVGRAVLRKLSAHYLSCKLNDVLFANNEFGKPYYRSATSLKFNLSHSNKLAVIGFTSNLEIGIDIEKVKSDYNFSDIAQTVFSRDEHLMLNKLDPGDRIARFYELWTRKEAFIKGVGYGLSFPISLKKISVLSDRVELINSNTRPKNKIIKSWSISSFDPSPSYRAAVALNGKIDGVTVSTWNNTSF